ncbi:cytochrome-c oxidase, cbb3-type subunit III [Magnetovibrio sp.]|uniref:cytochrome-c oxidase, cbb3-type subunit III n=1 Tax=Magnetovibrio sp. TaxID=2024836 RepID=UPI002F9536C9
MANIERDEVSGTDTTGHEWDGIKELNTPMPRWWLWTFYATILFSAVWWVLYPSWPTLNNYWKGTLNYSSRVDLTNDLQARDQARSKWTKQFAALPITEIVKDSQLREFAMAGGKVIFADNCAPCHGSQGRGAPGYPVLADDDWLWGGSLEAIETTVRYGVRSTHEDTRVSEMPVFSEDYLSPAQISDVAEYVLSFSNQSKDSAAATRGAEVFANDCAACHGETGDGGRDFGAPKLNDGLWLYGNTHEALVSQISKPKHGIMPTWEGRLDDVSIKQVAIYVHDALGGGE